MFLKIFNFTLNFSKLLQETNVNFISAMPLLDETIQQLNNMRNEIVFDLFAKQAEALSGIKQSCVDDSRRGKRVRTESCRIDDNQNTDELRSVYYEVLDRLTHELKTRFSGTQRKVYQLLSTLTFNFEPSDQKVEIKEKLIALCQLLNYDTNLENLSAQFQTFRNHYAKQTVGKESDRHNIYLIYQYLMQHSSNNLFIELNELYRRAISIPASNVDCESGFSCLNGIKHYLRSTMTQERLSNLSIISIENDITIDIDEIVREFKLVERRLLFKC
jgi:hypothetical protein